MLINSYRFKAGVTDPNFANVSLLLHGTGANGSVTIADSSSSPKTVNANDGARISTSQFFYGNSSIEFLASPNTSLTVAPSSAFQFGTGPWTVEGWLYQRTKSGYSAILEIGNHGAVGGAALLLFSGTNGLQLYSNGFLGTGATTPPNQWNHVAASFDGTTGRLFVGGILLSSFSFTNNLTDISTVSVGYPLGYNPLKNNSLYKLDGYLQELRITKGFCRYNATFTLPTAPFPDS